MNEKIIVIMHERCVFLATSTKTTFRTEFKEAKTLLPRRPWVLRRKTGHGREETRTLQLLLPLFEPKSEEEDVFCPGRPSEKKKRKVQSVNGRTFLAKK